MILRSAAVLTLVCPLAAACGTIGYPVSIETPIKAALDVSAFQRVFVAGFSCTGGDGELDLNDEIVRLLRSGLRNTSMMHVVENDPLHLSRNSDTDLSYWRRVGEEFDGPLIVTGAARFEAVRGIQPLPLTLTALERRESAARLAPQHDFERRGFALELTVVFIDGRTGRRLSVVTLHDQILYDTTNLVPALRGYFDLMNRMLPAFLRIVSDQTLSSERVLLK
jgi:hypothetical protein